MDGEWDAFWRRLKSRGGVKESWSKRRMKEILDRYVHAGDSVLDAGCGSGYFSAYFLERGCRTTALDYSPEALECSRQMTGGKCERYLEKDLTDPATGKELAGRFDVIFSDGLFEHFPAPAQKEIIDNFLRMRKDGGRIITFVPNLLSPWTVVRPFLMPGIKERPFTMAGLKGLHSGLRFFEDGGVNTLPVRHSPDRSLGRYFGMLLYVVGG